MFILFEGKESEKIVEDYDVDETYIVV